MMIVGSSVFRVHHVLKKDTCTTWDSMRERPGNQLIGRDRNGINAKTPANDVSRRADLADVS